MLLLAGALLATLTHHTLGFTDTEHWVGAEYTPAAAPGNGYVRARRHSRLTPLDSKAGARCCFQYNRPAFSLAFA